MADFQGSRRGLVAEVDCTGSSKPLCEKHEVSSYPTIMWGKRKSLQVYTGERAYAAFKEFADMTLGESCGPANLELCDENRRKKLEKFRRMSPESLDKSLDLAEKQIKRQELVFAQTEQDLIRKIQVATKKRDKKIKSIKEKEGLPQGPSHGALELTSDTWDEMVAGKTIFVKFFAPWCGHCKAIKHDWEKLMTDYEGTQSVLVAEADCTGKGKEICEDKGVTGYPRLMWGAPDELSVYSGGRSYEELKSFAADHLGHHCGPMHLELCEKKQKDLMEGLANMSQEKREEAAKAVEKAIKQVEKQWDDTQWNLTLHIDLAEQEKEKQIKVIKDQGYTEAKEVQAWNKKQPPGFWKAPTTTPSPSILDATAFQIAGMAVSVTHLLAACAAMFPILIMLICKATAQRQPSGKCCTARHIVMKSEEELLAVRKRLEGGEDFSALAKECSTCPSAQDGGSLGSRLEGSMKPEMNKVCFDPTTQIGKVVGPIKTEYGFHLVVVDERQGMSDAEGKKDK